MKVRGVFNRKVFEKGVYGHFTVPTSERRRKKERKEDQIGL